MLRKTVFQALKVTSLVNFWSCGTDKDFLRPTDKTYRFVGTVRFFKKNTPFGQRVSPPLPTNILACTSGLQI